MEASLVRMWASPSTLHLRVCVVGKRKHWVQFCDLHIPLDDIPLSVVAEVQKRLGLGSRAPEDPTLF